MAPEISASTPVKQTLPRVGTDTYIMKVASRCNIACTYCYMYTFADQSFRQQPPVMSLETVQLAAEKISRHAERYSLPFVSIVFHGGEPLLAGVQFFERAITILKKTIGETAKLELAVQTNGTLLNQTWLDLFHEYRVTPGISFDGLEEDHDRFRVNRSGKGTYHRVRDALNLCLNDPRFREQIGVLCVINPATDPLATFRHFLGVGLKFMDFLFPDHTYETNPSLDGTPYADWLIPIFDEWFALDDPSIGIRMFNAFIGLLFDTPQHLDVWGAEPVTSAVIETDGGLEPLDILKICGPSFTKVGLNIRTHEIDDLYGKNLVQILHGGRASLCEKCQTCDIVNVCGGGYMPWRYSSSNGFNNPAVYCRDLYKLINHVRRSVENKIVPACG